MAATRVAPIEAIEVPAVPADPAARRSGADSPVQDAAISPGIVAHRRAINSA
jgi:hypothetical protein